MTVKEQLLKEIKENHFFEYACVLVVFFLLLLVVLINMVKIEKKYTSQNDQTVTELREENARLRSDLANLEQENATLKLQAMDADQTATGTSNGNVCETYSDTAYNYLAIGNSITIHELTDYWWNNVGMAASSADADYVHRLVAALQPLKGEVCYEIVPMGNWELLEYDRAETLLMVDPYLDSRLDLVTVQLGDNVTSIDTFEADFEDLLLRIHEKAPNAQIIVVGDYMDSGEKDSIKERVAQKFGAAFVSLEEIKNRPEYQCGLGTTVYDADGNAYVVEHSGVAVHPGDAGMQFIANRILAWVQ